MSVLLALTAILLKPPVTELEYLNARPAQAGLPPQSQEEFDRNREYQARFAREYEGHRLRGAGFVPAEELRNGKRDMVRATISEPRLFIRMPGISLERRKDGEVTVTLSSDGRASQGTASVPAARWAELKALEEAAFAPDPPPPPPSHLSWRRGDPLPPLPESVCHSWGATLERIRTARVDKVHAHGCNVGELTLARLQYAEKMAEVALAAFPSCRRESSTLDRFQRLADCFGTFDPSTTGNP